MNTEQFKALYAEYFYYILIADIAIGLLIGVVPLILSVRRRKRNLGIVALIVSGITGALTPVLSLVVSSIFVFLVVRNSGPVDSDSNEISHSELPE